MAGPDLDPNAVAGSPLGGDDGGNTEQPEPTDGASGPSGGGMNSENAGALTGARGHAAAKKTGSSK